MTPDIGPNFIARTKFIHLAPSPQQQGVPAPPVQMSPDPDAPKLDLAQPHPADSSIAALITRRTSIRDYADTPLTRDELSLLLWCTQGVKDVFRNFATLRTVPSAGARHALETYLLINRVADLAPGLYHYLPLTHQLESCPAPESIADDITHACLEQAFIKTAAVTFIWTAVTDRMTWRYAQRGYRYLFLDAGHVCQNLYLTAESLDCGVCAIGAFDDDYLNQLFRLDGHSQFVIYLAALGKKLSSA